MFSLVMLVAGFTFRMLVVCTKAAFLTGDAVMDKNDLKLLL